MSEKLSYSQLTETINQILVAQFDVNIGKIKPSSYFRSDLGSDNLDDVDLDAIELAMDIEDEFGIPMKVEDFRNIRTVEDLYRLVYSKYEKQNL